MTITTYDPESVILTLGEAYLVGWNTISIARSKPVSTKYEGIRGKHSRVITYDNSVAVKLTLPMSNYWNDYFSQIVAMDYLYATGRCELQIKDNSGSTLFKSSEAFVTSYADITFDNTISDRVWTIQCLSTDVMNVGGSTKPTSSLLDSITSGISSLF